MCVEMNRLLTLKEVAERLRLSPQTIYRWVRTGKIEPIKLPNRQLRFRESEVETLLERRPNG